jgi:hypothetical protein
VDGLIEDAELVADAVANRRNAHRGERVHVTRGQPTEAAVAEPRFFLLLEHVLKVLPEPRQGLRGGVPDLEVQQVVAEMRTGEVLGGKIRNDLGARLQHRLDRRHVAIEQAIAHRQRERHVPVVSTGLAGGNRLLVAEVVGKSGSQGLDLEARPDFGRSGRCVSHELPISTGCSNSATARHANLRATSCLSDVVARARSGAHWQTPACF